MNLIDAQIIRNLCKKIVKFLENTKHDFEEF